MNISKFVFHRLLKKTGNSITMAYHMEQGSDAIDYETMCNKIASGLTTGRYENKILNFLADKTTSVV